MDKKIPIGQRIQNLRREKKITQKNFAKIIGSSQSHLSDIETERKGLSLAMGRRISEALGMKLSELLQEESATESHNNLIDNLPIKNSNSAVRYNDSINWENAFKQALGRNLDGILYAQIISDFELSFPQIMKVHKAVYDKPYSIMQNGLIEGKKPDEILQANPEKINEIIKYAKLLDQFVGTIKSKYFRDEIKDLLNDKE